MKRFILTVSVMLAMVFSCFAANPESDFIYDMAPDGGGVMIKQYKGTSTTVVFPDTIEGLPVTQIGSNDILDYTLFPNKDKRYNITVPKSVKVIGGTAFLGVKGKINIDLSNITSIGDQAFVASDLSGTITISKNLEFDGRKLYPSDVCAAVFSETKITAVVIEEGVTSLKGEDLFYKCPELKSVTIPASLTKIGAFAFAQCSALTEVKIPEGTEIDYGSNAFAGCTSLSLATKAKIKASGYTGNF